MMIIVLFIFLFQTFSIKLCSLIIHKKEGGPDKTDFRKRPFISDIV